MNLIQLYKLFKILLMFMLLSSVFAATTPKTLQFPLDHGKHATAHMEWWDFSGHLLDADQHLFGFSLTFLRVNVPFQHPPSKWTTQDIYLSNFTITDAEQDLFYHQEKMNRTSFNFAGASDNQLFIWNRGWQAMMNSKETLLQAQTNAATIALHLVPTKPIVLFGQNGYFKNRALYFYAFPRVQGYGKLRLGEKNYKIAALLGKIEHGFQEKKNVDTAWDKYIIHLNNGDDILIYVLEATNSIYIYPESFCIINHADGTSSRLKLRVH